MRSGGVRRATGFICSLFVFFAGFSGAAFAQGYAAAGGSTVPSPFDGPLLVPGSPDEAQQLSSYREAILDSPEAIAARERSRTAYENLNAGQARSVVALAFPSVINEPAGGPLPLGAGQKIVAYPSDHAAQVDLGGGKHGVIESTEPLALETSPGHREPLNLSLYETGGVFAPVRTAVGVRIPKDLAEGVRLASTGVSLTPVGAQGSTPADSEGVVDGAVVVYANVATDADTIVKPLTAGFEEDTLLRSVESSERLSFRVGLPAGASLVRGANGSGGVQILDKGVAIAAVPAPSAVDAVGTPVPVSMSVSGDTLTLTVSHHAREYQYPIAVDPTVEEKGNVTGNGGHEIIYNESGSNSTWGFATKNSSIFKASKYEVSGGLNEIKYGAKDEVSKSVATGETGAFVYDTQGESKIYWVTAETSFEGFAGGKMDDALGIFNAKTGKMVQEKVWHENYAANETVCAETGCATGTVEKATTKGELESQVFYTQIAREANEWAGGTAKLRSATLGIVQEAGPTASFAPTGKWVTNLTQSTGVELSATDPGLGINSAVFASPEHSWERTSTFPPLTECTGVQCRECWQASCGFFPLYTNLQGLPEGEDVIKGTVKDPVGLSFTAETTVKIDNVAPHNLTLTGLPPYNEIAFGYYKFKAQASDGSGSTLSAGVASIAVSIDGKEVGTPHGSCSPGPCTATGEWTVNGEEYAAGKHKILITATDGAGNLATEEATLTIHSAESKPAGPGSVETAAGAFTLRSTDASVASFGGGLSAERSFNSRRVGAGVEGPFGTQWQGLSFGGNENLTKLANGGVVFAATNGAQSLFTKEGTKFLAPTGDANLTLKEESASVFTLTDQHGDVTTFTVPSGGSGTVLTPSAREEPGHAGIIKYTFQTVGGVTEPTQALAPPPAGVTCTTLVKGCRALTFSYASSTTATGEAPAEWGEYKGRLAMISFTGYNPSTKAMQTTAVAQYSFDKQGRLRAEWDPRISPALKTLYGYDSEGHVTAVTEPGQQPWLMHYGTIESDPTGGRLLSVTRPAAATAVGNGIAPANTAVPTLSTTTPVQGTELTVANGTWSNSPLAYSYQWEKCNASGGECAVIPGATNLGYTPRYSDEEHTLVAQVTATNAAGTTTAQTLASSVVPAKAFAPTNPTSFGSEGTTIGKFKEPTYIVTEPCYGTGVAVSDSGNNRVQFLSSSGVWEHSTEESELKEPTGIAVNPSNHETLYVASAGKKQINMYISCTSRYVAYLVSSGSLAGLGVGANNLFLANSVGSTIEYFNLELGKIGKIGSSGTGSGQYEKPADVVQNPVNKFVYVADTGNSRVDYYTVAGKYEGKIGELGTVSGKLKEPKGIAIDSFGDVWVADTGNNRIEEFSATGTYMTEAGKVGTGTGQFKEPVGIALDSSNNIYVVDRGNDRVEKWTAGKRPADPPLPPATPPTLGTSAVETIEYQVPLSGSGAPHQMSSTTTAKWGQTDNPVEATAIFPPDEPMGWPAKDYKRATVYYRDSKDRTVNTATPSSAVSTTEYNTNNDVVRSLSPDNRVTALKESCESTENCKSAEVAKLLDSESTYNSEGVELQSTLGPQHTVKLTSGSTVEARDHQQYYYDEGAPSEGGPYRLVTKTTNGAQYSGKEEDVRTTTTSYSGQENLGWKLRKPTSITTDPSGLKLTHAMVYESSTGNLLETTTPTGAAENPPPAFALQFGSTGTESENGKFKEPRGMALAKNGNLFVVDTGNNRVEEFTQAGKYEAKFGSLGALSGQMKSPYALAVDPSGNVWVTDNVNNRLDEFTEKGVWIKALGFGVLNGESKLQTCTTTCKVGLAGSGSGQFKEPRGIGIGGGYVYVADGANNRVEKFTEAGAFVSTFGYGVNEAGEATKFEICTSTKCKAGTAGSAAGQFKAVRGLTVAPNGFVWVADSDNNRIEGYSGEGKYELEFGSLGSGAGQFKSPKGIGVTPGGTLLVGDGVNNRVQEFTPSGTFITSFGEKGKNNGQFEEAWGIAATSTGNLFVVDLGNNRVQEWVPNKGGAHTTQTIYYGTAANPTYPECGGHAEWANLPCQTQPAKQPETSGMSNLPVTKITYNTWDEPETSEEKVGSTTRTKTSTYEASGRLEKSAISSTVGTALPTVTDVYNKETGALEKQSTTTEGKTKTITSVYNKLGLMTSYTDADENTTAYEYEGEGSYKGAKELDGRLRHVNNGKGTETLTYNETTGLLSELLNEWGTTKLPFSAAYDVEGNPLTEGYPNGMTATYTYDQTGRPTSLVYKKTSNCTEEEKEKCKWFKDAVVPSIHGQWLEQTSTFSHQNYMYDAAARLSQVQNTPAGKGCTTRVYGYDQDTNRTSLTTYPANAKNECSTETTSTIEQHNYDTADRLNDTGTQYSEFGNITALPSADAGGKEPSEELTSTYYTGNQLASQTQNGQTIGYKLDPAGRTREVVETGKKAATVTSHYAGPGSSPAWTANTLSETTRSISGITGLGATQNNTEAPVLQLTNLHGDIVATAYLSETATALASTPDTSEFGVPTATLPPKYSWLGSLALSTEELPSGAINMGARSYVPEIGRFLQPDPIPGGSANAYTYTFGDPVNSSDPSGEYTFAGIGASLEAYLGERGAEAAAQQAAENAAARAEAERKAREAEEAASAAAGPQYEEEWEEWEEWYEEEGEYEYASYKQGEKAESEEGHVEEAVLVQPLVGEATEAGQGSGASANGSALPLCQAGKKGTCGEDIYYCRNGICHGSSGRYQGSQGHPGSRRRASGGPGKAICDGTEAAGDFAKAGGGPCGVSAPGRVEDPGGGGNGGAEGGGGGAGGSVCCGWPKD